MRGACHDSAREVHQAADQKDLQQWQRVMMYVQKRRGLHTEHIVGEGLEPREMRPRELIESMCKTVQRIVDSYDRDKEARELATHVEDCCGTDRPA